VLGHELDPTVGELNRWLAAAAADHQPSPPMVEPDDKRVGYTLA
jgi:thiamine biosynthesis lipoprotein ApbE